MTLEKYTAQINSLSKYYYIFLKLIQIAKITQVKYYFTIMQLKPILETHWKTSHTSATLSTNKEDYGGWPTVKTAR